MRIRRDSRSYRAPRWLRESSVTPAGEVVEDRLRPRAIRGAQLENRSAGIFAARLGHTVKVSVLVEDQAGVRAGAICVAGKEVQGRLSPCAVGVRKFENRAFLVRTS